jgi:hypothetical protein
LRHNQGYLFIWLNIGLSLIHWDTSCKRFAGLGVVTGKVDSFHVAGESRKKGNVLQSAGKDAGATEGGAGGRQEPA